MKSRMILCAALTLTTLAGSGAALAQSCSDSTGTDQVNAVLAALTPVLNTAWPSIAEASGLDPYEDVYDGKIDIGCKYGGDEICGAQVADCKKFYVEVDIPSIDGISEIQFSDLKVTKLSASSGTKSCPYDSKASGGTYACSYSGQGSGLANLKSGEKISMKVSNIKVKVKCEDYIFGQDFTETLYSGSATCTAGKAAGSATFDYCGGSCASGGTVANLSYAGVDDLDIDLGDVKCNVSPSYSPVSWIADILVPELEEQIVDAVTPPIEDALNDMLADFMPYPAKCSS